MPASVPRPVPTPGQNINSSGCKVTRDALVSNSNDMLAKPILCVQFLDLQDGLFAVSDVGTHALTSSTLITSMSLYCTVYDDTSHLTSSTCSHPATGHCCNVRCIAQCQTAQIAADFNNVCQDGGEPPNEQLTVTTYLEMAAKAVKQVKEQLTSRYWQSGSTNTLVAAATW